MILHFQTHIGRLKRLLHIVCFLCIAKKKKTKKKTQGGLKI